MSRLSGGWPIGLAMLGLAWAGAARGEAVAPTGAGKFEAALADVRRMVAQAPGEQGLVVAVTDRNGLRLLATHGYADIRARRPVTPETLFAIGSISKSFTAVALMEMADEGLYDPEAAIARYLPDFHPRSAFPPITGRALMSHSAGLPNYRSDLASMRYLILALNDYEPRYAPGAHFWYSNSGYQLLGYVAERIGGEAFPALLKRRLLDRLGMTATYPQVDPRLRGMMATSYVRSSPDGRYAEAPWFEYLAADGGIVSTGADMAAYARMLLNRGRTPSGQLLSPGAFARFVTPVVNGYAFGLNVKEDGAILEHGGSIAGFNALLEVHSKDSFGIAILSNMRLDRGLVDRIVARLSVESGARHSQMEGAQDSPEAAIGRPGEFSGRFVDSRGKEITFDAAADELTIAEEGATTRLTRLGRESFGRFVSPQGARTFTFFRDPRSGQVAGVASGANWYVRSGTAKAFDAAPPVWQALVGRYKAHGEEGPDIRCLVWDGKLYVLAADLDPMPHEIVEASPGTFRLAQPDYAPEILRFDSPIDGRMQRLLYSGQPLYRIDLP